MSDDFFEDDVAEKQPTAEKKPADKSKSSAGKVGASKQPAKASTVKAAETQGSAFGFGKRVDLTWVIVVGVIAFTIGFVSNATFFNKSTSSTGTTTDGTNVSAPSLSDEQINNYKNQGTLPSGHPSVPGMGTGGAASTQTGTGAAQGSSGTAAK